MKLALRIGVKQKHIKRGRMKKLIKDYEDRLQGSFVVVDAEKFRFRPLLFPVV